MNQWNFCYISAPQGNDQIRFELSCYALYPEVKVRLQHRFAKIVLLARPLKSFIPLLFRSSHRGGSLSSTTASRVEKT